MAAAGLGLLLLLIPDPFGLESGPGFSSPSGRALADTVFASVWWVAAVDLALSVIGFATAGLWTRSLPLRHGPVSRLSTPGAAGVLLCALLAVALRLPLASGSLWWDEAWSMRRVIAGQAVPDPSDPDRLVADVPPWSRPLFDYRKPTNHVFYNVLARASVDAWRAASGEPPGSFDGLAFRAPALAASALGVGGVGVLVARLGFPALAPAAALLLAIHPWHIKHGAEGRAYGMVLAASCLAALCLLRALRRGGWVDWGGFGLALVALLYAQPSAIYLVAALGTTAAAAIGVRPAPARERVVELGRLGVVGVASLMLLGLMMAPNVAQSLHWTDVFQEEQRIGWLVLVDLWANVATGISIYDSPFADPPEAWVSLPALAAQRPGLRLAVMGVLPVVTLLGLVRVGARSASGRALMLAFLIGGGLALFVTWYRHMYYYHRFLIYLLVPLTVGATVGFGWLLEQLPSDGGRGRWTRRIVAVGLLLLFQVAVWPQTRILLTRSYSPMREAAFALRELAGEPPSRALRGGLGLGGEMPALYDPWLRSLQTPEEFFDLVDQAERERRPLYLTYAYVGQNEPRFPRALALLRDPERFELLAEFRGIEPPYHYRVLRYRAENGPCCGPDEGGAEPEGALP